MLRLGVGDDPLLQPLDMEGRREGISYSIDSLRELHALHSSKLDLHFIIGLDAFLEIETWKEYRCLFDFAHFVVISRPGTQDADFEPFLFSLGLDFRREEEDRVFSGPSGNRVIFRETSAMDISSTRIRGDVRRGRSIRFLVPEAVRRYIVDRGLYRVHENHR
jgi:nicotinate-nucleotide adenylyltransferase